MDMLLGNILGLENTSIKRMVKETRKRNTRNKLISTETEKRLIDNNLTLDIDVDDSTFMPLDKVNNGFIHYPDVMRACKKLSASATVTDVATECLNEIKKVPVNSVVWRPIYEHSSKKSQYDTPSDEIAFGGITGIMYMLRDTEFGKEFNSIDAFLDYHYNRYLAWTKDENYRIRVRGQDNVCLVEVGLYNLNKRSNLYANAIDEQANEMIERAINAVAVGEANNPYQATWFND